VFKNPLWPQQGGRVKWKARFGLKESTKEIRQGHQVIKMRSRARHGHSWYRSNWSNWSWNWSGKWILTGLLQPRCCADLSTLVPMGHNRLALLWLRFRFVFFTWDWGWPRMWDLKSESWCGSIGDHQLSGRLVLIRNQEGSLSPLIPVCHAWALT
jgi:hypothetical protein